ncbi:bifunctional glutamate N-acetyltransferase/amino-acid acetyltransferase ArgJ [Lawsonella clevelandensis]|uniref:bifunctional glutamate N-acetyltransferase/amino-acid acetyltransferase ArgJ n=1 Tax=Lawsonella clevelandensis TaxID=1528099 RepID=UPI0027B9F633|nr:bifunctional glutamate N-acetyltransferase/amino-acid acetyltransferase ArgJ [Lawsonella clevelandensis]
MTITRTAGVTAAQGFRAAGVAAGVKKHGGLDMALIVNDGPHLTAAGVFTSNRFKAAPVLWSQEVLKSGELRAVILNSGGANACTGTAGVEDAKEEAIHLARQLAAAGVSINAEQIAICSTGVIGDRLPMKAIRSGIEALPELLGDSAEKGLEAATAIMTTDTVAKRSEYASAKGWKVGGMVKGAGMIAPSLATMLCVITTDAIVNQMDLESALRFSTSRTFDRLDVDGSTSTNDTVIVMANGASGVVADQTELTKAIFAVCDDLADQMMSDAEGVTKRCIVTVSGAKTEDDALTAARVVARDNLVKTALFGEDPNWGRVVATLGVAPVPMDILKVTVAFNGKKVFARGGGLPDARDIDMSGDRINVDIDLGVGRETASIRTTDLSHAYVEINSAYTT